MTFSQSDYVAMVARLNKLPKMQERGRGDPIGPVHKEDKIHDQIVQVCRGRGWIALHSRMDMATGRNVGEWDFTIMADGGRVFLIEVKTATGKLRPEQAGMIAWAAKLGHAVHVVRSLEEFCALVSVKKICDKA